MATERKIMFNFPRIKFVDDNGIIKQLIHLESEIHEAWQSAQTPDIHHTASEIMDIYHSAETALRILQEKHGICLDTLRHRVEQKNEARGYYDHH